MRAKQDLLKRVHQEVHQSLEEERANLKAATYAQLKAECKSKAAETGKSMETVLGEMFYQVCEMSTKADQDRLGGIFLNEKVTPTNKAKALAEHMAKMRETDERLPIARYNRLAGHLDKFSKIIKDDDQLIVFLKNPQLYINKHPELPMYDRQILSFVINDPYFRSLTALYKSVDSEASANTSLGTQVAKLEAHQYASTDALRFEQCINPNVKEQVIARSKKGGSGGPPASGYGAFQAFDRKLIASAAKNVRATKEGACHTFAQLAADDLLTAMEKGVLETMPIKLVSHKDALGSHTFLLVGQSDDLTDLSQCLIVDPWAVAMGYTSTGGVFSQENYPYPHMTDKLECVYDSTAPVAAAVAAAESKEDPGPVRGLRSAQAQDQRPRSAAQQPLAQELRSAVQSRNGFFNKEKEVKVALSPRQLASVKFLNKLIDFLPKSPKRDLMLKLKSSVESGDMSPEDSMKTATVAVSSRFVESKGQVFKWKMADNNIINDEKLVEAFNEAGSTGFWKNYLAQEKGYDKKEIKQIDAFLLTEIVESLRKDENIDNTITFNQEEHLGARPGN